MPCPRRGFLTAAGALALTPLAGCSLVGDQDDQVIVENEHDRPHEISIRFVPVGGDDPAFDTTVEVDPGEDETFTARLPREGELDHALRASIDGANASKHIDDGVFYIAWVTIEPDGELELAYAIR